MDKKKVYNKLYRVYKGYKRGRDFLKRNVDLMQGKDTPKDRVEAFINKLHPYQTEQGLIRIGLNRDGGYLIPDDLKGIKTCFSAGVGSDSDFDVGCSNHGMQLFLADKSVDRPNFSLPAHKYSFLKKHIGVTNNADFITLDEWVRTSHVPQHEDLLLKMDIEGAEYEALNHCSEDLMRRARIFVAEFHDLHKLWKEDYFELAEKVFDKLLRTHACVHIHPNNYDPIHTRQDVDIPITAEITFLRHDRMGSELKKYQTKFPHELDFDNCSEIKPVVLPKNWYHHTAQ